MRTVIAAALLLAACREETALLVFVDTDIPSIDAIGITVTGTDGSTTVQAASVDFETTPRPVRLSLVPHDEDVLGPIAIYVAGFAGESEVAARTAVTRFEAGEVLYLRMYLYAGCQGVSCDSGETCGDTLACVPETVAAQEYDEAPPGLTPSIGACGAECWHDCAGATRCETPQAVSLGMEHSCALTAERGVFCWGSNEYGQLGNGDDTVPELDRPTRVDLDDVRALSAGAWHTCAIDGDGTLHCWGKNAEGQIGIPGGVQMTASGATIAENTREVSGGLFHTCFVSDDDTVSCMGQNDEGQLGTDLATTSSDVPIRVDSLSGVDRVYAGDAHTCALLDDGTVECWGRAAGGLLGNGVDGSSPEPVPQETLVSAGTELDNVVELSVGANASAALIDGGAVRGWGLNAHREVGIEGSPVVFADRGPEDGSGPLAAFTRIASGFLQTCGVRNGELWCWGWSNAGALGVPRPDDDLEPGLVARSGPAPAFLDLGGGDHSGTQTTHGCLVAGTAVECWGQNAYGQLGLGHRDTVTTPTALGAQ